MAHPDFEGLAREQLERTILNYRADVNSVLPLLEATIVLINSALLEDAKTNIQVIARKLQLPK